MAPLSEARAPVRSVTDVVRESFITGVAVVVPVVVTTFVFAVLFNTLYRYLALVAARYTADVAPAHADRPRYIAERERTDARPAERADRDSDERERTDGPPAERTGRDSDEEGASE